MVNKTCCFYSFGTIALLLGAALIVVLGGVFKPFIVEPLIQKGVKDALHIDYNNYNEADKEKFRLEMKDYDFYYFNVTNFAQVQGHVFDLSSSTVPTPNLEQKGPYTYRYYEYKEDIVIKLSATGDELINFRTWWFYNADPSNNDQNEKICNINPIYMGALNGVWQQSYYTAAALGAGFDEFAIERQSFALFSPQVGSTVVPTVLAQMVPQMGIGLFTVYFQSVVQTLLSPPFSLDIDTIMFDWRTKNSTNGFAVTIPYAAFTGFELDTVQVPNNPFLPGGTLTSRLFSLSAQYSLRTSSGWNQWLNLLTLASKGDLSNTAFVAFGNVTGPDIVTDLVIAGVPLATAQAQAPVLVSAFFQRVATWIQTVAAVTPATVTATSPFSQFVFGGLAVSGYPAGLSFTTWEDFGYAQLATHDFSTIAGLGNFITVPAAIVTPVTSPLAAAYGSDRNIRYYGLELVNYGLGVLNRTQVKTFWADWGTGTTGTDIYASMLGIALNLFPVPLTSIELQTLGYLNAHGFTFSLTNVTLARQQALVFVDYIGSTLTTFVYPKLASFNTGLFTCRKAVELTKGFTDVGLNGAKFPGFFYDTNVNYTGAFRTWYTGKNNADIARFYYDRNNVTSFRSLVDLGRASECPINLATRLPVCHDIWSDVYGDNTGITVNIQYSSTFSYFGPFQEGETPRPLQAFNSDLLRTVNLTYDGDEDVKGITTRRYKLAAEMLQDKSTNPANSVYRMTKQGVAPMKFAVPLWGFTLSRPHFVDAPASVRTSVAGLDLTHDPDYQTYVWVEPLSGAVMQGTKKLQGSFDLKAGTFDERLYGRLFPNPNAEYYWPLFWANERGVLNDSQASDFKDSIYKARDLANLLSPIGYGVGAGIFVIGLILIFLGCKGKNAGGSTQLKSSTTL